MDEAYIGAIVLFAGPFAPRGWAYCDGSILSIAQNSALFAVIGTYYGGNGQTTFALPDLRGRVAVGAGNGPGQSPVVVGQAAGTANMTLLASQMPAHNHQLLINTSNATSAPTANGFIAASNYPDANTGDPVAVNSFATSSNAINTSSLSQAGGNQPFSVMQPYLGLNYIICTQGIFPSRN